MYVVLMPTCGAPGVGPAAAHAPNSSGLQHQLLQRLAHIALVQQPQQSQGHHDY